MTIEDELSGIIRDYMIKESIPGFTRVGEVYAKITIEDLKDGTLRASKELRQRLHKALNEASPALRLTSPWKYIREYKNDT